MLTCQQVTELVTDYLEGRMSFARRLSFQLHLGMCHRCRAYLSQMRTTVRLLGHLPAEPLPAELRDELLARFRARHPAAAGPGLAPRPASPVAVLEGWIGATRGWLIGAGLVAVAIVLALLSGAPVAAVGGEWPECLATELGAALLPVAALGVAAARTRVRPSAGTFAAVSAGAGFVGYVWLRHSCPDAQVVSHALVVHAGALLLGVLLGAAASWLPALRRAG
jgi:hypothetical protein